MLKYEREWKRVNEMEEKSMEERMKELDEICIGCPYEEKGQHRECVRCPNCDNEMTDFKRRNGNKEIWKCDDCDKDFITEGAKCVSEEELRKEIKEQIMQFTSYFGIKGRELADSFLKMFDQVKNNPSEMMLLKD